jgi:SNF2 family DNA or RNA helicase
MLIFSQFKRMLDIIELYLRMKGISYEKLTGSVKNKIEYQLFKDLTMMADRTNRRKTISGFSYLPPVQEVSVST